MDLNKLIGKKITLANLSDDRSLFTINFGDEGYIEIVPWWNYTEANLDIEDHLK